MKSLMQYMTGATLLLFGIAAFTGCGGGSSSGTGGTARASVVLANTSAASGVSLANAVTLRGSSGGGPVDVSDILSLTVTITKIYLHYCEADDDPAPGQPDVVLVKESEFDPSSLQVKKGGTVRWEWTADGAHTITSGNAGDPDAGSLFDESGSATGDAVELTFADSGCFPYFSNNQTDIDAGMAGNICVDDESEQEDKSVLLARSDGGSHGQSGEHGNGGESGDDDHHGSRGPLVFDGAFDVNLLDLTALSQVLTTANIPAGDYCRIELWIENPRLVLASDPNTEITNIHLTANGRLFIKDHFEITGGKDVLIVVDFGGIHLVLAGGSGQYVLTPKLRADVQVTDADVELSGEIVSIDTDNRIVQVQTGGDIVDVSVPDGTAINTDDDADETDGSTAQVALTFDQLAVGQQVEVQGTLTAGGQVDATDVTVDDASIDTTTL